eukprot:INCI7044.2.p1 GENE.INCI7044.2~~INCI7044.2.p1  ORF type:complete len:431 (+),score=73.73 INCI7044.2:68-1360(+)
MKAKSVAESVARPGVKRKSSSICTNDHDSDDVAATQKAHPATPPPVPIPEKVFPAAAAPCEKASASSLPLPLPLAAHSKAPHSGDRSKIKSVASPLSDMISKIAAEAAAAIASGSLGDSVADAEVTAPTKRPKVSSTKKVACSIRAVHGVEAIGQRPYMEDRHTIIHRIFAPHDHGGSDSASSGSDHSESESNSSESPRAKDGGSNLTSECTFVGVYDGHGGSSAVNFVHEHMHSRIAAHPRLWNFLGRTDGDSIRSLQRCFAEIFSELDDACIQSVTADDAKAAERNSGTTVLVAVVANGVLHIAHVGDTRAVVCRGEDRVRRLTTDHKPNLPRERRRIVEAGGAVVYSGCWRAACTDSPIRLAVSRALGDAPLKAGIKCVSNEPDVEVYQLTPLDEFIVFCSDGVWDVLSDLAVTNIVTNIKVLLAVA